VIERGAEVVRVNASGFSFILVPRSEPGDQASIGGLLEAG
jgi:hypothetical protein